ncbi:serine O-acetyltransferase [Desulfonauticus submarinus]|uniref:serine O-acetyltransferase n=1 Tax=Desulfonauticus submarinus TaxID=206665 RepID=A0A1H0B4A9_9BACT|nr:serine O-acetyltransferase EpsC [Desulfonauticus submarinus]SDN40504.1 serine O-acetyltransferase [Desulfonauticus submarinus]
MDKEKFQKIVFSLVEKEFFSKSRIAVEKNRPLPSVPVLKSIVEELRSILFPGYFGPCYVDEKTKAYYLGASLDKVYRALKEQILCGACFVCAEKKENCEQCEQDAELIAQKFLESLPTIRELLVSDVMAAYVGDPAAKTPGEAIFCYPSVRALTNYRLAHALHKLGVKIIPRIITEMAHSETGIDIHPGAEIGKSFFIDHGTGTVIGETCIIGNNVRIYQGVTLGAKSFPKDEKNMLVKGLPRHPIVEDEVIIYAGATILGRVTIGRGSIIGGNVWITHDVAPGTVVRQAKRENYKLINGEEK